MLPLAGAELHASKTSAPDHLTESELIGLMERYGIGTDASIPVNTRPGGGGGGQGRVCMAYGTTFARLAGPQHLCSVLPACQSS